LVALLSFEMATDEPIGAEALLEELGHLRRTDPALWLEYERQGEIAPEIMQRLKRAGFFRMLTQPDLGGFGFTLPQVCQLLEQIATIDGSLAWLVMAGNGGPFFTRLPPAIVRHQIFAGDPNVMIAGSLAPGGKARRVPGGFQVSGRWGVASGISHADWVIAACAVYAGDHEARRSDGSVEQVVVWVPRHEAEVITNWTAMGMQATGSHDFVIRDAIVPSTRAFSDWSRVTAERTVVATPTASLTALMVGSMLTGMARTALDLATGLLREPSRSQHLRRGHTAYALAEAAGSLRAARHSLHHAARNLWDAVGSGVRPSADMRASVRLAAINAGTTAVRVASTTFELGGLAAAYPANRLEKSFRDIQTGARHAVIQPGWYEQVGQFLLGLNSGHDL
jgi:indole-3-acetate monooxygenase